MTFEFSGPIWFWKGPAPWHFVTVPPAESAAIKEIGASASYGWGMIPVDVTIGATAFYTAMFEKDGAFIVPLRANIRKREKLVEGDMVSLRVALRSPAAPRFDALCSECGSRFRSAASTMEALCPECAHWLYGHAPCVHEIEHGRCLLCGWDGSASDYVRSLQT